jgi:hypothetical protein
MRNWYVVHRAGKRLSAVAESFRSFLLEEAGSLLDSPVADLALVTGGSNGSH